MEREPTDKIYNKFIEVMGRCIMEGRRVVVTVNKVAELTIAGGQLRYEIVPEFIAQLNGGRRIAGGELKPARQVVSEIQQQKQREMER